MNRIILPSCVAFICVFNTPASGEIIFDDFNLNEGHFISSITGSGTTVGEDPASTIERITLDSFEGAGNQQLHLIHDATTTAYRVRHLSGGGAPASNVPFTITSGVDGFIGFYVKTTATGWETSIILDGPTGATGEMDSSTSVAIIADGEWHLYEWDLDSTTIWGAVPGITAGNPGESLALGQHTIDSIYFRDLDGSPGPTADIFLDFVAKSDSGSIAALVPEPSSIGMIMLGISAVAGRRRRQ